MRGGRLTAGSPMRPDTPAQSALTPLRKSRWRPEKTALSIGGNVTVPFGARSRVVVRPRVFRTDNALTPR
jgi:hypothetical protein